MSKKQIQFYLTVLAGALLLLFPAFYNGYPLINPDDGTYINSGFLVQVPEDRPIIYGLLLRLFSINGISLWIAVFVQSLTVSWLLLKIISQNTQEKTFLKAIVIYLFLSFFTSLSWVTSEIIPDICTPIVMMCLYLIIINKETKFNTFLLYGIFLTASATHMSHFLMFISIIAVLFFVKKYFFKREQVQRVKRSLITLAILSFWATVMNASVYSNSKHIFLMASMLDKGVLKSYLNEHCNDNNYKLCKYKNTMSSDPNWFLWSSNSPLYLEGGWSATKNEYNEILREILTTPKYFGQFTITSIQYTWKQLLDFKIGDGNIPFKEDNPVYWAIQNHVQRDLNVYTNAWQHQELITPKLELPNKIIYYTVGISLLALLIMMVIKRKTIPLNLSLLVFLIFISILINAADCAAFAQVNGRYGSRMMWLIPFCEIVMLMSFNTKHLKNIETQHT